MSDESYFSKPFKFVELSWNSKAAQQISLRLAQFFVDN